MFKTVLSNLFDNVGHIRINLAIVGSNSRLKSSD